ncbi:MAG: hypothetical protein ACI9HK_000717 [Pirellulaceae bacterium]|jgi:hypothetical protein
MSALIISADDFEEWQRKSDTGREFTSLKRIGGGGGNLGMSYRSCEELIEKSAKLGVDREAWPNYIESDGSDISVQELRDQNMRLFAMLKSLMPEERASVKWLVEIYEILESKKLFYISH